MVGHHEHWLLGQIKPAEFHRGGRHGPGLSRSHDVGQERTSTLKNSPDRILLMGRKIAVTKRRAHHSRQREMRTIEISKPDVVEAEIVIVGQALSPSGIFPNPLAKAILQLLLLFACGDRLRLVHGAVSLRVLIVGRRCTAIQ